MAARSSSVRSRYQGIALLLVCLFGLVAACEGDAAEDAGEQARADGPPVTVVPPEQTGHELPVPWDTTSAGFRAPEVYDGLRQPAGKSQARRPNVVLITTDDQTLDEMRDMPKTRSLFARSGVMFEEGLSPNPLCCPARAEILSGQFSHNNGVRTNFWPYGGYYALDSDDTLPVWLQNAGYRTAFLGKYLNQYGKADPGAVPPGWDVWKGATQRATNVYDYYNVVLNENGELRRYPRSYQTDLYADKSVRLIDRFAKSNRPFFLWESHIAPHTGCRSQFGWDGDACWHPPDPAHRHAGSFAGAEPPQRSDPSYNEADVSDKPQAIRDKDPLDADKRQRYAEYAQRRAESLQAVDDAVVRTMAALDKAGVLDETLIIFASDNGFLLGEHRTYGKNIGYEPAVQVPLLMRGPGAPAGVTTSETGTLVDIAPTILAAADAEPGLTMDGRNLLPVVKEQRPGWNTVLIQGGPNARDGTGEWRFLGARSSRYTYLQLRQSGETELYDRKRDPSQLRNVAGDPAYAAVEREMRRRLDALEDCAGQSCRRDFGPEPRPRGEPGRTNNRPGRGPTRELGPKR